MKKVVFVLFMACLTNVSHAKMMMAIEDGASVSTQEQKTINLIKFLHRAQQMI